MIIVQLQVLMMQLAHLLSVLTEEFISQHINNPWVAQLVALIAQGVAQQVALMVAHWVAPIRVHTVQSVLVAQVVLVV